jgi:hypothetical protein
MNVQAEVDREKDAVGRITAVARRTSCPCFADLCWGSLPSDFRLLEDNPGVMFESPRRIVVFQELGGELRYYAGGWCRNPDRIFLEQDRIHREGSELGVFPTVRDALVFAERYLVEEASFREIQVPRQPRHQQEPSSNNDGKSA